MKVKGRIRSRQSLWGATSENRRYGICDLIPGNQSKDKRSLKSVICLWNHIPKEHKSNYSKKSKTVDCRKENGIRNLLSVDSGRHDY